LGKKKVLEPLEKFWKTLKDFFKILGTLKKFFPKKKGPCQKWSCHPHKIYKEGHLPGMWFLLESEPKAVESEPKAVESEPKAVGYRTNFERSSYGFDGSTAFCSDPYKHHMPGRWSPL
jgi:hypothetical protein